MSFFMVGYIKSVDRVYAHPAQLMVNLYHFFFTYELSPL